MVACARKAWEGACGPNVGRLSVGRTVGCSRQRGSCSNRAHKRTGQIVVLGGLEGGAGAACARAGPRARDARERTGPPGPMHVSSRHGTVRTGLRRPGRPCMRSAPHARGVMVADVLLLRTRWLPSCSFLCAALCVWAFRSSNTTHASSRFSRVRGCSRQTETRTPPQRRPIRTTTRDLTWDQRKAPTGRG